MLALLLNDVSTCLLDASKVLYNEPGIAHTERRKVTFGNEALAQSRLHPSHSQSFFLQKLNQDRVQGGGTGIRTQADLVYQHLLDIRNKAQLRDPDPLWLVVASDVSAEQLGLLYGIALRAEIPIRNFVDASVLAAASYNGTRSCVVLDIGLHRTVLAGIDTGEVVKRQHVDVIPQLGWLPLMNLWVRTCSERSLDESRFDPRKLASTEQQLFDQLLSFIGSGDEKQNIALELRGTIRGLESSRADLASVAQDRYRHILAYFDGPTDILLSNTNAHLPGLIETLEREGHHVNEFDQFDTLRSVGQITSNNREDSDSRTHYLELPHLAAPRLTSIDRESVLTLADSVTHVLVGHIAHPLTHGFRARPTANGISAFEIENTESSYALTIADEKALRLNGNPIEGQTRLVPGDELEVGEIRYRLITVHPDG